MNEQIMEVEIRRWITIYRHVLVRISSSCHVMLVPAVKRVDLCSGSVHEQPCHMDPSAISLFDDPACSLSEVTAAGLVL